MESDGPPRRVVLALKGTCHMESRAALHWALNTLSVRPGVDSLLLLHVVKSMKVIADGRLGLPYAAASPLLQLSVRHMAMAAGARDMQHYFQVCARKHVLADVQLCYGDRCPSIIQAVEEFGATHLVMGVGTKRGQFIHFWKGSLTQRVVKSARCSVLLINRRAQLETTHEYAGDRGVVGTNADGSLLPSVLSDTRVHDGPAWQHPDDELSPEAIAEREATAERVQAEVDTWRRNWAATRRAPLGSAKTGSEVSGAVSKEAGKDVTPGAGSQVAADEVTAGDSGLTAGIDEEFPRNHGVTPGDGKSGGKLVPLTARMMTAGENESLPRGASGGGAVDGGLANEERALRREGSIGGSQRFWDDGQDSGDQDGEGVPSLFICCISQDVMVDPVIAADGQTYERIQIAQWLRRKVTSPLTNLPLSDRGLIPNVSLKEAIKEWQDAKQ